MLDTKLLASALSISKAGAYQLLNGGFSNLACPGGRGGNFSQSRSWLCGWTTYKYSRTGGGRRRKTMKLIKYEGNDYLQFNDEQGSQKVFMQPAHRVLKTGCTGCNLSRHYRVVGQTGRWVSLFLWKTPHQSSWECRENRMNTANGQGRGCRKWAAIKMREFVEKTTTPPEVMTLCRERASRENTEIKKNKRKQIAGRQLWTWKGSELFLCHKIKIKQKKRKRIINTW